MTFKETQFCVNVMILVVEPVVGNIMPTSLLLRLCEYTPPGERCLIGIKN